jgi:hypothetical protein
MRKTESAIGHTEKPSTHLMSTAEPTPPSDSPLFPLVAVAGPPGSGGEIVAVALAAMGLRLLGGTSPKPAPDGGGGGDVSTADNSGAALLGLVGDEVLGELEGTWWAPPELSPGWEDLPEIAGLASRLVPSVDDLVGTASPSSPGPERSVWYDVRHAVLLPFWRRYHPGVEAAVITWRRPAATVAELAGDGISPIHGLAIWEAQLVGACKGARGLPVLGVDVDEVMADPKQWAASAASFLEDLGLELPHGAVDRAVAVLEASLGEVATEVGEDIVAEEATMASRLDGLLGEASGAHDRWDPPTTATLSPWTAALLAAERAARLSATQAANAWLAADGAHRAMTSALSTLEWTLDRLAVAALRELPPAPHQP